MALTIPAADLQGTLLNNLITNLTALVAANPLMAPSVNNQILDAQQKLVVYLVSNNLISSATILAGNAATYIGSQHPYA